ncbi:MAG TPA: AAA family ATPase [Actinomycetota bacterium]|nr:AAA family ATPase [Actinomycetota bacterium]
MAVNCSACGHANPDDANFCSKCAAPLVAPGAARKERKFATALFADLVGSTTLAETEDAEVVQAAIGGVFDRLAKVIAGYDGLLEKYMGDAILAVFGVPVVHEDDSERAIRAGLDMQAVLSEMNRIAAAGGKPELEMRIGIESGDILVDLERAGSTRDRMLTGDAVNTAARLQSSSDIGRVLVGPTAYASTKGTIDFSEPKMLELKGKAEPVAAYTALRITAHHAGQRASLGIESRMVGRDAELAVLQQTLHRVEKEGRPALVTVLAPAGSGKSRLVRELGRYLDSLDRSYFWRTGRCLPYGDAAYSALVDAVKAQCEVLDDDPIEVAAAKVEHSAEALAGDAETTVALKILLGLNVDSSVGREKLFDLWRRYLERLAARYPLVLVFEDIHWADDGLLDLIEFLADWAQGPIMLVTLARPEVLDRRPTWGGGKRNYAAIYLDPLDVAESDEMLTDMFGRALSPEIKALISERSEGNPLYTEEIVRMLIDRRMLVGSSEDGWALATTIESIEIPRSINALIAARVDGLAAEEKALLQDASVVGRIFWSGVAARLAHQDALETLEQLGRLRIKELITRREPSSLSHEHEFGFHHALIRDVAYESLPKKLRVEKHTEVARWAESGPASDRDDVVELIATHLNQALTYMVEMGAGDEEVADLSGRAFEWAVRAAERAARVSQTARALDWYRRALALAEASGCDPQEIAAVWEALALTAVDVRPDEDALEPFRRAIEIYEAEGCEVEAGRVKSAYSKVLFVIGDEDVALALAEEAVSLLRVKKNLVSLAGALANLAYLHFRSNQDADAERFAAEAVELASLAGDRPTRADALNTRGLALTELDRAEESLELFELSGEIAAEIGDLRLSLRSSINVGWLHHVRGDLDGTGQRVLEEAVQVARRHGHEGTLRAVSATNLCLVYTAQGRFDEAEALVFEALREAPTGWVPWLSETEVALAQLDAYRGQLDAARAHMEKARSYGSSDVDAQREIPSVEAAIAHLAGDDAAALDFAREAISLIGTGLLFFPEVVRVAVKLSVAAGRRDDALAFRNLFEKPTPMAHAFGLWCDGYLATDLPRSAELFAEAADHFDGLRVRLYQAQCWTELARVNKELGRDHMTPLRSAMDFFHSCGARLLLEHAAQLK